MPITRQKFPSKRFVLAERGPTSDDLRKRRLEELLTLACIKRGWTKARLGKALGRDASNLLSDSGNPKLDYLVRLAAVLEWPLGQLAATIWGGEELVLDSPKTDEVETTLRTYDELRAAAHEAFLARDYGNALELARRMESVGRTPEERAFSIAKQAAHWNNLGRHPQAIDAATRGLQIEDIKPVRRLHLQTNLVLGLMRTRQFAVAMSLAGDVIACAKRLIATEKDARRELAFSLFARGTCHHELMMIESDLREEHAVDARQDLVSAAEEFRSCAIGLAAQELAWMADTCDATLLELRVANGSVTPSEAIQSVLRRFESVIDPSKADPYMIESIGWWAIAGCNIAVRHLGGPELQRTLAICTNKAIEAADAVDNWCLRERAFTLQFLGHQRLTDLTGLSFEFTIDAEDRARIASLIGRFPHFQALGSKILSAARVIEE